MKKFFIKICKLLGYEILDQNNFSSPTLGKELNEELSILNEKSIVLPLGEVKITKKVNSILIVLRMNTNIEIWDQNRRRLFEHPKIEYTKRSLNSLIRSINFLKKTNYDIVTSRAVIKNKEVKIPKYSHLFPNKIVMKYKNPFIHGTLFLDKNIFEEVGGYDENFYFAQDYKLYSDCYKKGKKIYIINEVLYELNDKDNISNKNKEEQKYYFNCARKNITPNVLKADT